MLNKTISSIESEDTVECNEEDCANKDTSSKQYSDSLIQNNEKQVDKSLKLPRLSNNALHKRQSTSKLSPINFTIDQV